jgi:hypothetical protein
VVSHYAAGTEGCIQASVGTITGQIKGIVTSIAVPAEAATYHSVHWYDQQTNISYRWLNERESVQSRVRDNHTNDEDNTFHEKAYRANLVHIDQLVKCVFDAKMCTAR